MSSPAFLPRPVSVSGRGFLARAVLMPFLPAVWREARSLSFTAVLWPWLVVALVAHFGLAGLRAWEMGRDLTRHAPDYDRQFDPIVFENGTVRVEGPRLPRFEDERQFFIVDPEETVSTSSITTSEYAVVRRTEIVRRDSIGRVQRIALKDLGEIIGHGPIVVKSDTILAWWQRHGLLVQMAVALLLGAAITAGDAVLCPLFALLSGAIWLGLRGRSLDATFGQAFRMAFASSAMTIVVSLVLNLLGHSAGLCLGCLLWPALMAGGCLVASIGE